MNTQYSPFEAAKRKLTAEQAEEVAIRYKAGGVTMLELAVEYNVGTATIYHVMNGKSYKYA